MQKYLVCKFTSSEGKSPSQAVFNSMVWHSGISRSKFLCGTVHPSLICVTAVTIWGIGVFCEQWANVDHLSCFHCNLTYFPGETLGTPAKPASEPKPSSHLQQVLSVLVTPSAAQPHHDPGWQEDANWFSASFPHWFPKGFADSGRESTRMKSWGTAAL